ncbi:MAG: hypothetical protein QOF71_2495, partial [Candidatus Eremiobacteraeota bacterium]|nr:hypothetical protein [Candidatus Eremiobacteraeota bacterium]
MRFLLSAALFAALVAPALSQTPSPSPSPAAAVPRPAATSIDDFARARLDAMFRAGHADAAVFSATFLAQVPVAQIDSILAGLKTNLGAYKSIAGTQGDYTAQFEKGSDEVLVHLDSADKIDGMLFKPPKMQAVSLDDGLRVLRELRPATGTLSYVILEGRTERAALEASAPLAVGSAFKLAVLAAVRDEIARGRRHWTDVVPLDARWKTLPSGVIRTWPDNTPITLATYAAEMISISDNTAADALVRLAGPAALAPYAFRNAPFLTTREMFVLKSTPGAAQREAYLAARTPAARAAVLRAVDALPLPGVAQLVSTPILAIEWQYSVRELCDLMGRVADLPLMSINPGVADPASFRSVAFKGGSDTGIINLT